MKGRPKGSLNKRTIARRAAANASPETHLHALSEMRQASIVLRNIMEEAINAYNSGQLFDEAKLAAMEFVANCVKDYIRAQKEIVPYEDAKLVNLKVSGDPANPLHHVQELDLSRLSDDQLLTLRPILVALAGPGGETPPGTH
jgi:hypothetical protein